MATSRLDDNLNAELEQYERSTVHPITHTTIATKFATDALPHHAYAEAIGKVYDLLTVDLPEHLARIMELYEQGEYQQAAEASTAMEVSSHAMYRRLGDATQALRVAKT